MSADIITVGDTTTHGGVVITGSPTSKIRGKAIARLGDLVNCPQCYPDGRPHGINRIIQVAGRYKVGGIPGACAGDVTECGCELVGSQPARA
ncbi:PAAR domain-containing protein [Pandoraea sp. NPDC090278]|uniref:PAAR domain-containing protein n=1 Tax=Pandoraea sp. NPDC090278 TaxID=3364391 RepID=UPI00383BD78D